MGSYPLLSLATTHVEVELGCDNNPEMMIFDFEFGEKENPIKVNTSLVTLVFSLKP